ncbi:aspartate aminotransferase [Haematococcus lacustris]|uniref:Aspartate aminotransferase n=2 Tax=Haematococcus lacustris TaxID=44745 RepID=A0A699YMX9_HAELA|nr:aspartate aminotransferase [Haematococcus lacustris]
MAWLQDHVTSQIGMFAYSGMTETMVDALASKHSIYMTRNGRISMAGVNTHNVHRLATAMHDVITTVKYLPIAGMRDFVVESMKLAFGEDASVIKDKRVAAIQTLSGTGSCRIMADFQHRFMPRSKIYIPVPTWSNHNNIWADAQSHDTRLP